MIGGWLKGHRKRFENPLFTKPYCRGYAWDWLCAEAAIEPTKFNIKGVIVTIERGQLATSYRRLAKEFGWSRTSVERFLTRLKTGTMIDTATGTGQMILTICNYEFYQQNIISPGQQPGQQPGQERDRSGTLNDKGKKGKKEKKEKSKREEPNGFPKKGIRLSEDWTLPKLLGEWAVGEGLSEQEVRDQADVFRDYWIAQPGQKGVKLNWEATWRNWIRKHREFKAQRAEPEDDGVIRRMMERSGYR